MKELFSRLGNNPGTTTELILISFVANILALASPVFVMLVLGRYVAYGIDATLFTLVGGLVIALTMEFVFRQLRLKLARGLNLRAEVDLGIGAFGMLASCQTQEFDKLVANNQLQLPRNIEQVSSAFNATNLCAMLDVPFAALFLVALFILNPVLGLIATVFAICVFPLRFVGQWLQKTHLQRLEEANASAGVMFNNVVRSPDTVRTFDPSGWLLKNWSDTTEKLSESRSQMVQKQGAIEIALASYQVLLGAIVIAVGATYVVTGELEVGALIGCNILAARALAPLSRLAQLTWVFHRAGRALVRLRELANIQTEDGLNCPDRPPTGRLEFRDISFTHPGMPASLFENLNVQLSKGGILLVNGANGTGKTTFLRLILGLLDPDRGQIFSDGIDVQQFSPQWWRLNISYMPQEPSFFDATIGSNLINSMPSVSEKELYSVLEEAGLKQYIDENTFGLDLRLVGGGANLALGIRKRMALARALLRKAPIGVFDEPTEGLDLVGRKYVYAALNRFSRERRTIIVASDDNEISKMANFVLDLDVKPVPTLQQINRPDSIMALQE